MAVAELLASFKDRHFITVYKGPGKNFTPSGSWLPFRKRDQLREGQVLIRGKECQGAPLGIQTESPKGSRRSHPIGSRRSQGLPML